MTDLINGLPQIVTRERAELEWAVESGAMVASVHEQVGGCGGSCSGDRSRTGKGN